MTTNPQASNLALSVAIESESTGAATVDKRAAERALSLIAGAYGEIQYRGMERMGFETRSGGKDVYAAAEAFAQRGVNAINPRSVESVFPVGTDGVFFFCRGSIYLYFGTILHGKWVYFLVGAGR